VPGEQGRVLAAFASFSEARRPDKREGGALGGALATDDLEARLLRTAQRGHPGDFVRLLRLHERRLRVLAFRVLRDPDLVDDALQEAALRAYRSLDAFRAESSLHTWLSRITYTTCMDLLDEKRRQERLAERSTSPQEHVPDPAELFGVQAALSAALDALSAEQRAVVLLVLQQGLDYATVADILGIAPGTVASRLFTSRKLLWRSLGRDEDGGA
jgi:RNA polymerase sigma factor (sigma-70 family)